MHVKLLVSFYTHWKHQLELRISRKTKFIKLLHLVNEKHCLPFSMHNPPVWITPSILKSWTHPPLLCFFKNLTPYKKVGLIRGVSICGKKQGLSMFMGCSGGLHFRFITEQKEILFLLNVLFLSRFSNKCTNVI